MEFEFTDSSVKYPKGRLPGVGVQFNVGFLKKNAHLSYLESFTKKCILNAKKGTFIISQKKGQIFKFYFKLAQKGAFLNKLLVQYSQIGYEKGTLPSDSY